MVKNVNYKSIFMGDSMRYLLSANVDGVSKTKVLSLNEGKNVKYYNDAQKIELAENIFGDSKKTASKLPVAIKEPVVEQAEQLDEKRGSMKVYRISYTLNNKERGMTVKASSESGAIERIHKMGGNVTSVQVIDTISESSFIENIFEEGLKKFKSFRRK
jgi:hypothetical protein